MRASIRSIDQPRPKSNASACTFFRPEERNCSCVHCSAARICGEFVMRPPMRSVRYSAVCGSSLWFNASSMIRPMVALSTWALRRRHERQREDPDEVTHGESPSSGWTAPQYIARADVLAVVEQRADSVAASPRVAKRLPGVGPASRLARSISPAGGPDADRSRGPDIRRRPPRARLLRNLAARS